MATSEALKRAIKKYQRNHYDQIIIRLKKGDKARIQNVIKNTDMSINNFVKTLVEKELCLLEKNNTY